MSKECITIDGAMGEGGGQVLRASLALSMALQQPFRICNIRANRPKPGLKRQHLTCVLAAQEICRAKVTGAELNSTELTFTPGAVVPGDYTFSVGSGGSCTLVLQALLPALMVAEGPSSITVTGGTHVPMAPVFEYTQKTLLPWLERLGPKFSLCLHQPGFMQVGGGSMTLHITPSPLTPYEDMACHEQAALAGCVQLYNLEEEAGARGKSALLAAQKQKLGLGEELVRIEMNPYGGMAQGAAHVLFLELAWPDRVTVFSAIGERGKAVESMANKLADKVLRFLGTSALVDSFLADQVIVPLALAGGGALLTEKPSLHTLTCLQVVQQFSGIRTSVERRGDERNWIISLG